MGTKKGQRRKTARRAYSGYEVTYNSGAKRMTLRQKFRTKAQAKAVARAIASRQQKAGGKKRLGRNPRVRKVR